MSSLSVSCCRAHPPVSWRLWGLICWRDSNTQEAKVSVLVASCQRTWPLCCWFLLEGQRQWSVTHATEPVRLTWFSQACCLRRSHWACCQLPPTGTLQPLACALVFSAKYVAHLI